MSKFIKTLAVDEVTLLDVASSTVSYIGKAVSGSLEFEGKWKISKLITDSTGNVDLRYADSGKYTQIWNNRASLSYA